MDYPRLALSFKGDYAVLHQLSTEDKVLLLAGDGVVSDDETVLVPTLDGIDNGLFSGAFVLSAERARTALSEFLRHGSAAALGDWQEL